MTITMAALAPARRPLGLAVLAAFVLALTGGLGLLVPRIHGLCGTEFHFGRVLLGLIPTVPGLGLAALLGRGRPVALAFALAWPGGVVANVALGQDPLCAWLNWEVGATDFRALPAYCCEYGSVSISNHEQVDFSPSPTGDVYYVASSGGEVPGPLREVVGRDRW